MNFRNSLSFLRNICSKREEIILKPRILVGCGNPLLDISASVQEDILQKYELKHDNAILAEEKHKPLCKELVATYQVDYTAGGSVLNTLRACQWILQKPHITVFFGGVGNDENAKILHQRASKEGVVVRQQYVEGLPTGTCTVLIHGPHRSLVASLGAAERFSFSHLNEKENWCLIENAKYFYISGFFMAVSSESVFKLAQHAEEYNNCFAFNLSALFVLQTLMSQLRELLPYVDILFCNGQEADEFAIQEGCKTIDRKEIGKRLQCYDKINCNRQRIVIITQCELPVLLIQRSSVEEFKVPEIPKENLVDTNGAGDGFVGGFLAQYILGKPLAYCIHCGIYVAQHIIRQSGIRFKGKPNFSEKLKSQV